MAYQRFAYHYDRLMEDMPYPDWIAFARQCWDKFGQPRTVVDLGCGTGSLSIPLAQLGYDVTGIDLSEDMLAVAQHKAEEAAKREPFPPGGAVRWLQQDMREWELGRPADTVISFCDCFNYLLEEEDVEQTIHRVYEGLKPGGVFAFDMHTPYLLQHYYETQPFLLNEDDIAYIWTCDFDPGRCEIEHALTIFVQENQLLDLGSDDAVKQRFERVEEYHVQRAYPLEWVRQTLKDAGFSRTECAADFLWKSPTETTQRAFFVAVK